MNEHPPFPEKVGCGKVLIMGLLLLLTLILGACNDKKGHDPGNPSCVNDRGQTVPCPSSWG